MALQPETVRHQLSTIMVRVPNWVGDAVMALPALKELRRIFSGSRITIVSRKWVAGLFEGEELSDDLIPVGDLRGFAGVANFVADARRLRRRRFDLAVLLQNAFSAALLARAAGVKKTAGYATDGRRLLLDFVVPFEPNHLRAHQVRYYLNIVAQLERHLAGATEVNIETAQPRLHCTDEQRKRAILLLEESGIGAGQHSTARIVAINPGATNSRAKRWPAQRFAATADRLAERDGFQTIIIGAEGDLEVAREVASLMRARAVILAGQTSIAELKGLLSCASLVVSNDTGTAHVSAALGVPTVVVFGPTEHVSTRPLSEVARVVRHDVECSPCMLRDCPIDHRCMTRVEVDDVYRASRSLMVSPTG
ncbi:MAG TPA: lipopolysaccharide heptosyltransferase II [Blastocatellia bacterium]|nr:lipopolysaccharide heptosyltransferase II [Blastocatellia bacterium]